jgi:hypothetical protein
VTPSALAALTPQQVAALQAAQQKAAQQKAAQQQAAEQQVVVGPAAVPVQTTAHFTG